MKKTSLYLPERLKSALTARAEVSGRSEAEVVRDALDAALAAPWPSDAPRPQKAVAGRFVGVGVGPGDPDLLTVRAVSALRRADRVMAPTTAVDAVGRAETIVRQAVGGVTVERVAFSMTPSPIARRRSVDRASSAVARRLDDGEEVAWITLGDPLTYSTFASVAAGVRRKRPGTVIEQVPGIMAFQALAARTGTVVAHDRTRIVIRTAIDQQPLDDELADPSTTVVVYKGGRRLPELARAVAGSVRGKGAVAGELLGMPGERVGTLADVAAGGPASYLATVILPAEEPPRR